MAEEALVGDDIEAADNLLKFLDANGYPVSGALWLYHSDDDRWRFVISFREKRDDLASFYRDIAKLMNAQAHDRNILDLSRVDFVDSDRSVIGSLSKALRVEGNSRVRYTNNRINGVFLEDALIFRLSA